MRWLLLMLVVAALPFACASIIDPSATGANSETYLANFNNLIDNALDAQFNTTINFTVGTTTYLTTPEFTSATECGIGHLQTTYVNPANMTWYEVRSDLFSEVGVVLAASSKPDQFNAWYNTLLEMNSSYGGLPLWVVARNNSGFNRTLVTDTASDGSSRSIIALYVAAKNKAFTSTNRSIYLNLANNLTAAKLQYEVFKTALNSTYGNVTYLPSTGRDCANGGVDSCTPSMNVGYFQDDIRAFQLAYEATGNVTYDYVARNFTAGFLAVSLTKDTDGDGFGVAPFNFDYNHTGNLSIVNNGGANPYYFNVANVQWDNSDAPRALWVCDTLRVQQKLGAVNGIYSNLSQYCLDWSESATYTSTTSTYQYYFSGSPLSGFPRSGYYENGLGAGTHTFYNSSSMKTKVDEALTHMSWTGKTFDSSPCGTGLSYRGIRVTKALLAGMDKDEPDVLPPNIDVRYNNTVVRVNDTISIVINATDNVIADYYVFSSNLSHSFVNQTASKHLFSGLCYQQFANQSSACGGFSNGSYRPSESEINYVDYGYWNDGDYLTAGSVWGLGNAGSNDNWTKPQNSIGAIWTIAYLNVSHSTIKNVSVPQDCWSRYADKVRLHSYSFGGGPSANFTVFYCSASSDYNDYALLINEHNLGKHIYETGGVYWGINNSNTYLLNVTTTRNLSTFSWRIYANDSSNNWNVTDTFNITINKYPPNATPLILNKPLAAGVTINGSITFEDFDNDTWVANWTKWYKDGVEMTAYENLTNLSSGNATPNSVWVLSWRVKDLFNWSDWKNDSVTIGDDSGPSMTSFSATPSSITLGNAVTLCVNATDAESSVAYCKLELYKEDYAEQLFNITTGLIVNGESFCRAYTPTGSASYVLEWRKARCWDSSNNMAEFSPVSINVSISSGGGNGGGGGGGGTTIVYNNVTSQAQEGCDDDEVCEEGEDFFSCSGDCQFSGSYLTCSDPTQGCFWKNDFQFIFWSAVALVAMIFIAREERFDKVLRRS